jgi:hypothetical protein
MKELFTALYTKSTGSTLSTALGGRLYNTIAPQGQPMPFCVFSMVSGVHDWTFTEDMEDVVIQFSLFESSQSPGTICDNYNKLIALYDNCALSVSSYTHILMHRQNQQLLRDEEDGVWHYVVEYRIIIEKAST